MQAVYDPKVAKAHVNEVWTKLQAFEKKVADTEKVTRAELEELHKEYLSFPSSYQIDWAVAGLTSAQSQTVADSARTKLNSLGATLGSNRLLPRLFNADNA
jgi:hypothetical protein